MSLRGFFSRKNETHRRRKNGLAKSALAAHAEFLEDRVLLSVESPLLVDHGVNFTNQNVLGRTAITFFPVDNPLYSNNNGQTPGRGNGNGLNVVLDGAAPDGSGGLVAQLRSITYTNLIFNNNSNCGSVLNISNMTLDEIVIDSSVFTNNGRSGFIIRLNNAQVGRIVITNSTFANNAFEGLSILSTNSRVDNLVMSGNAVGNSGANDGSLLRFTNSRLGVVQIGNNQFANAAQSGLHMDLDNTNTASLELVRNTASNNRLHGLFLDFTDSDVRGSVRGNSLTGSQTGDGLSILMRRSVLPNGQVAGGLRNLDLNIISDTNALGQVQQNDLSGNARSGINIDLGQNTTYGGAITNNTINNNGRVGLNLQAKDTQDAFDVMIGGETVDEQNVNLDANTIDGNIGAGIAINLDDTSNVIGNTTGRFQILNNIITNSVNDNVLATQFAGEGVFVRARGSVALVNGAARILNSRIDGNTISGNASHGMAFDISEDSEVVDLLIGDIFNLSPATGVTEGFEGDGFFFQGQFFRNSGNQVTNNGGSGLSFLRRDAAVARDVKIIDNLFDGNADGIDYTVRNLDNVVNTVTIQHNDTTNNLLTGMTITTQIDALLRADLDNNMISGNQDDGILTLGFEGDATDLETLGGLWTRNTIQNNAGRGININGVPGTLAPLVIGMMGTDAMGRSMGNLIDSNGNDGVEINAPGFIELTNNIVTSNGQNNTTLNVHGDGKGIDINLNDVGLPFSTTGGLNVQLRSNIIQSNFGDGLEILSRANEQVFTRVEVLAYGNIIDLNLGRGVDVLNSGRAETYLVFGDGSTGDGSNRNIIRSNGLEGFYTVNTTSVNQRQDVDALVAMVADTDLAGAQGARSPDLTLDINGNEIQQNGLPSNPGQLNGSGLVVRVGTSGTIAGGLGAASIIPDHEGVGFNVSTVGVGASNSASLLANGRVNARVNNNIFGGNLGVDVITESFTSTLDPGTTAGPWDGTNYRIDGNSYRTDPLARLNFEFTNNTGNSVDLVRLGAFYNNAEGTWKSRTGGRTAPDPNGPFGGSASRFRNAQRLPDRSSGFQFDSTAPTQGSGGLFFGMFGAVAGSISSITPGGPNSPIVVSTAARTGTVQDASNATPIVITSFNHGLASGEFVQISGITGNTAANGIFQVTVLTPNTFSLQDSETGMNVAGNGNYTGGGTWTVVDQGQISNMSGNGVSPIVIADFSNFQGHGLVTGDTVTVIGVQGNTNANGTFTVTVIDQFRFSLNGTTGNGTWVFGTGHYYSATGGHGLTTGDNVLIDTFSFPAGTTGFDINGTYTVTVISPNTFALNGTEGETDVPLSFFGGTYQQIANFAPIMYPGVGDSTFRIIESGNNFDVGGSVLDEPEILYGGGGAGHLSYTYDIEAAGTFNFRTVSVSDATVTEGGQAEFVITLSEALNTDLVIGYLTEYSGSASDGIATTLAADFTAATNFVVIPAGQTQASVLIDTLADTTFEGSENFKLTLTTAQSTIVDPVTGNIFTDEFATLIDATGVATILDDDTQPTISISNASGFEIGNGVGTMTFTVTLSNPSAQPVFVEFSTQDATANVDQDYRFNQGTLTFAPGETVKTITVEILADDPLLNQSVDLDQETLFVNLTAPQGATIVDSQGIGTIFDARFIKVANGFANGDGDSGTSLMEFVVTLTDANGNLSAVPAGQMIVVNFSTQNGTATAGSDYTAVANGMLTFNEFETTKSFFVTVNKDRVFEGDERFMVNINSTNGTAQGPSATGNILEPIEFASTRTANGQSIVRAFDIRTNTERFSFNPYPGFVGEAHVAVGDFNNDGINDFVTAAGAGAGPHVRVFNGANGQEIFGFFAYGADFVGGVWVATGDVNNDGTDDIVTGPDTGGGPHIRVFDGLTGTLIENFMADTLGLDFTGGVRVASADVDGLAGDDIILGFGPGSLPLVQVFTSDGDPNTLPTLFRSFNAYDPSVRAGVFVAAADFGGGVGNAQDGFADIVTGAGQGGGSHVRIFNGNTLAEMESFFAYGSAFFGGVRVATGDVANDANGMPSRDRIPELLTAPGFGGQPHVRAFSIDANPLTANPPAIINFFAFPNNLISGTFIAGRDRGLPGAGSPLLLDASATSTGEVAVLTRSELAPVIEAAFNRLSAAGVSQQAIDQLRQIEFVITDLDGLTIGLQTPGRIQLDRTAAGRGYFVDLTPDRDEEFERKGGQLIATDANAQDRVDLLSVLLHELEHALGQEHVVAEHHLLAPTILPGERRLPEQDLVFADADLFESLLSLN